ncbi:MAG: hypothetical protein ACR2MD_10340 [Aridibacter sp.]
MQVAEAQAQVAFIESGITPLKKDRAKAGFKNIDSCQTIFV